MELGYVFVAEPEGMGDRDISDSMLCPFAAAFAPDAIHGRTVEADNTTRNDTVGSTVTMDCEVEELYRHYQGAGEGCPV